MSLQLVLEFGIFAARSLVEVANELVPTPRTIEVLYTDKTSYEPPTDPDADLNALAADGIISSFMVKPASGTIRYVLGLCPYFDGEDFSCWLGTVEFIGTDYGSLWRYLLARHDLPFVCLGFEEGVSIVEHGEEPWFSWSDPTLVIGAIRRPEGDWDLHRGPRYDEVQIG